MWLLVCVLHSSICNYQASWDACSQANYNICELGSISEISDQNIYFVYGDLGSMVCNWGLWDLFIFEMFGCSNILAYD